MSLKYEPASEPLHISVKYLSDARVGEGSLLQPAGELIGLARETRILQP